MVSTIKFSEFAASNLNDSTNKSAGLSGGANATTEIVVRWTTAGRPSAPFNGLLGYNTDLSQYEYWDSGTMMWFQLGTGDTGTVTLINTGTGLTGGPITETGTISFAAIAASSLWANVTGGSAVPTVVSIASLTNLILPVTATARQMLQSRASDTPVWSTATWPATTTINQILYSSSNNVVGEIATAANAVMSTSAGGLPGFSTTLPSNLVTTDPVLTQGIATKNYVDKTALNGTSVYAASAATLGTVTQSGAGVGATITNAGVQAVFALDGVSPPAGSNVLIKNTATGMTAANEGIYTVSNVGSAGTNWVLTRATSYDTDVEINQTGLILVQNGSTLAGTAWYNAATIVTVDTTAFNYNQFGNIIFPITLANGGTSASLVASNGGIVYSTATAMAISAVGASGQLFQSAGAAAPGWTTATYPATAGTVANVMTSDGTNWVSSAPAASGTSVIVDDTTTNATMYPTWVTAATGSLPLKVSSTKMSFNPSTATMMLAGALSGSTGVKSSAGLNLLTFGYVASAVNYWSISNNATTQDPYIFVAGSDSAVNMQFQVKGGVFKLVDYTGTIGAQLNFYNAALTHYTGLKVATAQATDLTLTLPAIDGAANSGLVTNASGVLSFTASAVITQVNVQVITATGAFTYTPTTGTKYAIFELQGGGGGSGGTTGAGSQSSQSGPGGGGAYIQLFVSGTANLAAITGSLGIAGTAGASGNNNGGAGGNTTLVINGGSTWTASGGGGGTGATASAVAAVSSAAGSGGSASTGANGTLMKFANGANGGVGFTAATNGAVPVKIAEGGGSFISPTSCSVAASGVAYGGGASGFLNSTGVNQAGVAGIQGIVIVTEFISA